MGATYTNAEQAIELAETITGVLNGNWFEATQVANVIEIKGADGTVYTLTAAVKTN